MFCCSSAECVRPQCATRRAVNVRGAVRCGAARPSPPTLRFTYFSHYAAKTAIFFSNEMKNFLIKLKTLLAATARRQQSDTQRWQLEPSARWCSAATGSAAPSCQRQQNLKSRDFAIFSFFFFYHTGATAAHAVLLALLSSSTT